MAGSTVLARGYSDRMANLGDRLCPTCGAHLRRTRDDAGECDPCRRAAPALTLDPALWDEPGLSAALAHLDFGPVFLRVRAEKSWSQHRLAELFDMDQSTLSKIENGKRSLTDAATVIRCANVLAIPAGKLGFRYGVMVGPCAVTGQEGGWMDRRDFLEQVAGLVFGAGAAGVDIHRLLSLSPWAEPTGTRHVGAADVEAIEQATAAFRHQDFAQGSGLVRDTAVARLHAAARRAQRLPDLAGAHALAGDTDTAVSVGHQAVDAVTAVHSPRAYGRLHRLHTVLEPLHTSPGVAELRDRLTTTA